MGIILHCWCLTHQFSWFHHLRPAQHQCQVVVGGSTRSISATEVTLLDVLFGTLKRWLVVLFAYHLYTLYIMVIYITNEEYVFGYIYIYVYVCMMCYCMCIYMFIYIYIDIDTCLYIYMFICIDTCLYIYIYMFICIDTCLYIYIYKNIYVCIWCVFYLPIFL